MISKEKCIDLFSLFEYEEGQAKDWICIYPAGSSNAWVNVVSWKWSSGEVNGQKIFNNFPTGNQIVALALLLFFNIEYYIMSILNI